MKTSPNVCTYECNCLELNSKLQQYFIIMIANVQRPGCYHGSGVVVLNLQTFNRVRDRETIISHFIQIMNFFSTDDSHGVSLLHDVQNIDIRLKECTSKSARLT